MNADSLSQQEMRSSSSEVFSIVTETVSPNKIDVGSVCFSFNLEAGETIHDIFLRAPCQHKDGFLYGNEDLLANYPGELNHALALYNMPGNKFDLYEKTTGQSLCSKCRCDTTTERVFYLPFSTDPLFKSVVELWSRKYQQFRVEFSFNKSPAADQVKLYVKKIVKLKPTFVPL